MNFKELRQTAEYYEYLKMQKNADLKTKKQLVYLKNELNKYIHLFYISPKEYKNALTEYFKSLGKTVKFITEEKTSKYSVTELYIISIFAEKFSPNPEKRYTWKTQEFAKDKERRPSKVNLAFELFYCQGKTSLFIENKGLKEVYWNLVKENCKQKFRLQGLTHINSKTGKREYDKFNPSKTDLSNLQKPDTSNINIKIS